MEMQSHRTTCWISIGGKKKSQTVPTPHKLIMRQQKILFYLQPGTKPVSKNQSYKTYIKVLQQFHTAKQFSAIINKWNDKKHKQMWWCCHPVLTFWCPHTRLKIPLTQPCSLAIEQPPFSPKSWKTKRKLSAPDAGLRPVLQWTQPLRLQYEAQEEYNHSLLLSGSTQPQPTAPLLISQPASSGITSPVYFFTSFPFFFFF